MHIVVREVGSIELFGVGAMNGIVLVSVVRQLEERGMLRREAARDRARFFALPGVYEWFADRPTETPLPVPSRAVPDGLNERS